MADELDDPAAQQLRDDLLAAGIRRAEADEVFEFLVRSPTAVAIAVIGEHSAGKTSIIAAITDDPAAHKNIGPGITTKESRRYLTVREGLEIEIWDTPGLGTEFWDHDADVRDRITKADAVVVAVTTELLDDVAREQLRHLLVVGRKVGASLFVVTKSDREVVDRKQALEDLQLALAPVPAGTIDPVWTSARQFIKGPGGEQRQRYGIQHLEAELLRLAQNAARERLRIRGAIRSIDLIDQALPMLVDTRHPELRVAIELQQRLRRLLGTVDRRIGRVADRFKNELRMRAADTSAQFGYDLEELVAGARSGLSDEVELAWRTKWQEFQDAAAGLSDEFAQAVSQIITEAASEVDHLNQGILAQELRSRLPFLMEADARAHEAGPGEVKAPWQRPGYAKSLNEVIDNIGAVADVFVEAGGLDSPFAAAADLGKSLVDLFFSFKEGESTSRRAEQAADLKRESRARLNERADQIIQGWDAALMTYRGTVSQNITLTSKTEASLHELLGEQVALADRLRKVRATLEESVPEDA